MRRVLITGGAGFVGSFLAKRWKSEFPKDEIIVFDNLRRRGSELNLADFKKLGIQFIHGDIRHLEDLKSIKGNIDLLIEASAEPSVLAGINESPNYLIQTNLMGALNCLEFMKEKCPQMIFLSTSRVYSIESLRNLPLETAGDTYRLKENVETMGLSKAGVNEQFNTNDIRSLYGTTKLSAEYFIAEYLAANPSLKCITNRCGVLAGPGQWGKVDQGVFTLWMAQHAFDGCLNYTGFEGKGLQVRDLLHPEDLFQLLIVQAEQMHEKSGGLYNIGGGQDNALSLQQLTNLCREISGKTIEIGSMPSTNPVDIPYYVTDYTKAKNEFRWQPKIGLKELFTSIHDWLIENEAQVRLLFRGND